MSKYLISLLIALILCNACGVNPDDCVVYFKADGEEYCTSNYDIQVYFNRTEFFIHDEEGSTDLLLMGIEDYIPSLHSFNGAEGSFVQFEDGDVTTFYQDKLNGVILSNPNPNIFEVTEINYEVGTLSAEFEYVLYCFNGTTSVMDSISITEGRITNASFLEGNGAKFMDVTIDGDNVDGLLDGELDATSGQITITQRTPGRSNKLEIVLEFDVQPGTYEIGTSEDKFHGSYRDGTSVTHTSTEGTLEIHRHNPIAPFVIGEFDFKAIDSLTSNVIQSIKGKFGVQYER